MCLTVIGLGEGNGLPCRCRHGKPGTGRLPATWDIGTRINLETALRMGDELGGHLLSGHVDGSRYGCRYRGQEADSLRLTFTVPA